MAKNITAVNGTDDLASVFPIVQTINIKGREIEVSPFKFKVLLKVLTHVSNLFSDSNVLDQYGIIQTLLTGVAKHPEDVISILKLSTGIQEDSFYEDLESTDGVKLILATWEVNKDFFSQNLGDKLKNLFPSQDLN